MIYDVGNLMSWFRKGTKWLIYSQSFTRCVAWERIKGYYDWFWGSLWLTVDCQALIKFYWVYYWSPNKCLSCMFVLWCLTPLSTIISVISWRSVLLVEETGGPGKNHRSIKGHWQTLSHNVVYIALSGSRTHNISGDRHWLHRYL